MLAWLAGESILIWRWAKVKAPPTPGALALSSGLFVGLAVIAQYQPARATVTVTAWALDLAILLQLFEQTPQQQAATNAVITGWPPPMIDDPSVIIPSGTASKAPAQTGTTAPGGGPQPAKPSPAGGIISKIWHSLV